MLAGPAPATPEETSRVNANFLLWVLGGAALISVIYIFVRD